MYTPYHQRVENPYDPMPHEPGKEEWTAVLFFAYTKHKGSGLYELLQGVRILGANIETKNDAYFLSLDGACRSDEWSKPELVEWLKPLTTQVKSTFKMARQFVKETQQRPTNNKPTWA